jgi:hypothetical protein
VVLLRTLHLLHCITLIFSLCVFNPPSPPSLKQHITVAHTVHLMRTHGSLTKFSQEGCEAFHRVLNYLWR